MLQRSRSMLKPAPEPEKPAPVSAPSGKYDFTFENFIKGPSNQFAYAAAQAVASNPSGAYTSFGSSIITSSKS